MTWPEALANITLLAKIPLLAKITFQAHSTSAMCTMALAQKVN